MVELAARDDEVETFRGELEAARRAAGLADVAREADAAQADLSGARAAAESATVAAADAAAALAAARAALELEVAGAVSREKAAAEVKRLEGFVAGAGELAAAREALETATAQTATLHRDATAADVSWRAARDRAPGPGGGVAGGPGRTSRAIARRRPSVPCVRIDRAPRPGSAHLRCPGRGRRRRGPRGRRSDAGAARRDASESAAGLDGACRRRGARRRARLRRAPRAGRSGDPRQGARRGAAGRARPARAFERAQSEAHAAALAATGREAARASAAAALAGAEAKALEAGARLAKRLAEAGFADEAARKDAHRDPSVTEELQTLVSEHDQGTLKAAERLRLAERAAEGLAAPDLARLEADAQTCEAAARGAREAEISLRSAAAAAERQLARLDELATEAAGLEARYEVIGRLADVANRRNDRGLSFQSYVLGAFLDDVLIAASARLRAMSKSRYALERTEERSGRRLAAGLGLLVYDAWTGVARPVSTLSGGEKFMAALSLALGLAEVVQAHAGGIRLETVFVDEGFGSLDDESLDLAISSLMSLNEGGRLVGIISHVSELRERIDARLEVSAGKSGSSARFVVP